MIWLIGCRGMLGREIAFKLEALSIEYVGTDIETDITDKSSLESFVSGKKIDWIINCSAYTAVDKAESEESKAFQINCVGVRNIAETANLSGARLIHFSTDYVFDGRGTVAYVETDPVGPVSAYGRTKLQGEEALVSVYDKYFILRISWLYGIHGNNFVKTMLRLMSERDSLGVVDDQKGAPTYTSVLADNVIRLILSDSHEYGIYHYSDEGVISWYDFALKIYEYGRSTGLISKETVIKPITTDMYPTPASRPSWSVFNKAKVKERLGFNVVDWDVNLKEYIAETVKNV